MPNNNLETSKANMKTRIRNRVQAGQTAKDLGRLAKSAKFVGLVDDSEVESELDAQMVAAIPTASVDELVAMSEGIRELRTPAADMGQVSTADNLTEGGNKFLKSENVQPAISVSGDLSYANGVVAYSNPASSALQVVATVGDLPASAVAGDQAVVQSNNKLYIRTADGWYAVALINTAPTVSGNAAEYTLAVDQTPTVITLTAVDPENDVVTFSHSVVSGDLNGTTVAQTDNVFTITPHATQPASFELAFSADDSVNVATTSPSSFTLAFSTAIASITWDSSIAYPSSITNASIRFGNAIDTANGKTVIGAEGAGSYQGKAYIYDHAANTMTEIIEPAATAHSGAHFGNGNFGAAVAINSTHVAVGTREFTYINRPGRVYIYELTNLTTPVATLTGPSGVNSNFAKPEVNWGEGIWLTDDKLIVTMRGGETGANNGPVKAYSLTGQFLWELASGIYGNRGVDARGNLLSISSGGSGGISRIVDISGTSSPSILASFGGYNGYSVGNRTQIINEDYFAVSNGFSTNNGGPFLGGSVEIRRTSDAVKVNEYHLGSFGVNPSDSGNFGKGISSDGKGNLIIPYYEYYYAICSIDAAGSLTVNQTLYLPNTSATSYVNAGYNLGVSDGYVVAGMPFHTVGSTSNVGVVEVFTY